MKTIFLKTIKEHWIFIMIMSVISIATVWMYVALFPTFSNQSEEFAKMLANFPKEMWEIFGIKSDSLALNTLEQFLSVEMFSLMWPIFAIIIITKIGGSLIASEIDKGTIEILLSQPISRFKIIVSKLFASGALITIFTVISIFCIIPLAQIYNIDYHAEVYTKVFANAYLFMLCGLAISVMFSTIFEHSKTTMLNAGMYMLMYIVNVISALKDSLSSLQYLSFFHYLDLSAILSENTIQTHSVVVFTAVIITTTMISFIHFNRRDISV